MMHFVEENLQNKDGKCANFRCGFRFHKSIKPKANYYNVSNRSWVCASCAQQINRENLARVRGKQTAFKQDCISSEDALALMLKGELQF